MATVLPPAPLDPDTVELLLEVAAVAELSAYDTAAADEHALEAATQRVEQATSVAAPSGHACASASGARS